MKKFSIIFVRNTNADKAVDAVLRVIQDIIDHIRKYERNEENKNRNAAE
jgi:hypothetical protein